MLTFNNLSYSYSRKFHALKGLTGNVRPGICLLLGENGAGKTTLLKLATGSLLPSEGTIEFDGNDIAKRSPEVLNKVFFLPDKYEIPFRNINAMARYHAPFFCNFNAESLAQNLADFNLTGKEKVSALSLGNAHKSFLAYALALHTDLLLLDEPANGLDIDSKRQLRHMLSRCVADDQTVIISTHTISDLEMLYDSVIVLHHGQLLLNAPVELISEKLSFVVGPVPAVNALYTEQSGGSFRSIIPANIPCETAVDFELLYLAMLSPKASAITNLLNC